MSDNSPTEGTESESPQKKTVAKRTSKKTATGTSKKTSAKKAPARKKPTSASSAKAGNKGTTAKTATTADKAKQAAEKQSAAANATGDATMTSEQGSTQPNNNTSQLMEDLKGRDWPQIIKRALLMFFFGVLGWISLSIAFFLAAAQVVFTIFVGEANSSLTKLIKQFANYIHDVLDYLSFASDECPFPFGRPIPDAD